MSEHISKVLDKIENKLKLQQEKLKLMSENPSCIEYWADRCDGGRWEPLLRKQLSKKMIGILRNFVLIFGILSKLTQAFDF